MTPGEFESKNEATSFVFRDVDWPRENGYRCDICLLQEEDGTFTAIVLNLPGAASCGETEPDALRNVEESIRGLIEVYKEHGNPIPWKEYAPEDIPAGAKTQRILVNA